MKLMPPFTLSAPRLKLWMACKRLVTIASWLPTSHSTWPDSREPVLARTAVSPFNVTLPFNCPIVEAMDEDIHSKERVMSLVPGVGSQPSLVCLWTGVSSGNWPILW